MHNLKQVWPGCPRLVDHRCVIPNSYNMPRHAARQAMSSGSHFRNPQKSLTGSFCADTGSGYGTPRAMIAISPRSDAVTKPPKVVTILPLVHSVFLIRVDPSYAPIF